MVSTDSGRLAFQGLVLVILKELEILVVLKELDWLWLVSKDLKKTKKLTDIGFVGFWFSTGKLDSGFS